ncbi:hypothetical protein GCM10010389_37360 [Streptomyces echinoruber]|uniref:Uncharacterized protein n=1 Tax=Streptomyces echinoruber TaxID=68898 RepID=A0A918RFL6_9ACTN|nr:hypothetical protein GCM10010389_37360 [Streptomyces echinoruber]
MGHTLGTGRAGGNAFFRDIARASDPVLRRVFGEVRPAVTMLECGPADPRMRIEIEVDAVRGSGARRDAAHGARTTPA